MEPKDLDVNGSAAAATIQETTLSAFKGNFPRIENAEGVDLQALGELDGDPLFVTLPVVPQVGTVSKNGLLYDDALLATIETQIQEKRPGANFGHVPKEKRDTAFPKPDALWVGAQRIGDTLWGKAYVPPGAARDYIKALRAVGGAIATSINGSGRFEKVSKGVHRLLDFELDTLDFAPPARAALGGGGTTPVLTTEMDDSQTEMETIMPTKEEVIAELTAADVPASVRAVIVDEAEAHVASEAQVAELQTQVSDRDGQIVDLTAAVATMRTAEFVRSLDGQIAELADWKVQGEEAQKKLDAFRRTLRSRIVAELGDETDEEKVAELVQTVWGELKPLAETIRDALAGPPAIVGGKSTRTGGKKVLDESPEAVEAALRKFNFG